MVNRLYTKALKGVPGLGTPSVVGNQFLEDHSSPREAADHLRTRYEVLSGMTGFVCGLPGYTAMPVTIPSNIAGLLILQSHLCATIAVLGGHDPEDPVVQKRCIQSVLNVHDEEDEDQSPETTSLLRRIGSKLGERGLRYASERAARWVGRSSRRLPLVGGVIGGYNDLHSTRNVAERAVEAHLLEE